MASVSSLATYNKTPVSLAVGTTNVTIPLLTLSSKSKNVTMPIQLSYNPMNLKVTEPASEVGTGWSLFGGGVISRENIGPINEAKYRPNATDYKADEFDDVFHYNLPGISGRFRFNRNIINNTIDVENLSPNKVKITYIRNSDLNFFKINSFTITDEKGYKYIFSDYSESSRDEIALYRSAFFLTQIRLPNDIPVVSLEYRKDDKHLSDDPLSGVIYRSCKLTKIISEGVGSIEITYVYDANKENSMNDPYSISQILLKNMQGNSISGYRFSYTDQGLYTIASESNGRRMLDKLIKLNKDLVEYEKTKFTYYNPNGGEVHPFGPYYWTPTFDSNNVRAYILPGLLKNIISPTGGVVEYNYEPHEVFFNRNTPEYLQHMQSSKGIVDPIIQYQGDFASVLNMDTNQSSTYNLTISGDPVKQKTVYFQFAIDELYQPGIWVPDPPTDPNDNPDPNNPGGSPGGHYHTELKYVLKKDGVIINSYNNSNTQTDYYLYPGNYTIEVTGTGGKARLLQAEIKLKNPPYINKNIALEYGARIKSIKNYNSSSEIIPVITESFSYNNFNDINSSSGYLFCNEAEDENITPGYVLYKNITTTDEQNGYSRYYYKTPNDYPKVPYTVDGNSTEFWANYMIARSGILERKEVYNALDNLLSSTDYSTTLETLNNVPDLKINGFNGIPTRYTKPAYVKNTMEISRTYAGSQYMENKIEITNNNIGNYEPAYVKESASDGTISEKWVRYALDKNNTRLLNANMVSVPLEIETKVNGKLIGKIETKYDDISHLYPSSTVTTNPNDGSVKTFEKFDSFDMYGKIRQLTESISEATGIGVSSTIIWGYNQTLPIAKIEGAKLSDIGNLADDIIAKSNADINTSTEVSLINALDTFRTHPALKEFEITTFTYDPLVGITTITPSNGMRETFVYDNNRLKSTLNVNGNIVQEYKYNMKPQP
ncbi:hypothetical protein [Chryseobacterium defluvii]|uniref:hypothetical protein n=1 Tax=Chryseobacterium defluvii TaxID=160396 RepID=UPI0011C3D115|nr:hypothetical protein [Chryseobacterium defluvii]